MWRKFRNSNCEAVVAQIMWMLTIGIGVGIVVILIVDIVIHPVNKVLNMRTIEGVVVEKTARRWIKTEKYLVVIEDEAGERETLEVTDSLFKWRFDAAETWDEIEVGRAYSFEIGGVRLPMMPWYPNIYGFVELPN